MLSKSTLDFLKALKKNNNRNWFEKNRSRYENANEDVRQLTDKLISELSKVNPKLKVLAPKDCLFRIYRDVRFSKDKSPYKINMGASFNEGGKKAETAGLYFHVQPGNESFIAGGRWEPSADHLKKIRQEIDYHTDEFVSILKNKTFKKYFPELGDYKLSRAPKDYSPDHPHIGLLKYTSYIVWRKMKDSDLLSRSLVKKSGEIYKVMFPFLNFLNRAVS